MQRARTLVGISVFWVPLSLLADGFTALVVPQRVAALVDPARAATVIGLVTFVALAVAMLAQPIAGAVSDRLRPRWGRRGPLVAGAALVVAALAVFAAVDDLLGVAAAFVLLLTAASVAQAAQQGFLPDLVERPWRGRAAGLKGLADLGGAFVGFLVLGQLLAGGRIGPALAFAAIVVIVAAVTTVVLVREPGGGPAAPRPSSPRGWYGLDLREHAAFVRVVAARFLFLLGTFAVGRFFLLFVADRLGLDAATAADEAGGLLAALTLITAAAALPAGWVADRAGRVGTMVGGALVSAIGVLLLAGAASPLQIVFFGGLMAIGSAGFAGANWAMAADLAPPGDAARFLGLANVGTAGAAAVAGLFGPLADAARDLVPGSGYAAVLVAAAACFAVSALVARRLPAAIGVPVVVPGSSPQLEVES